VESLSQPANLHLDRMGYGHEAAPQKTGQDAQTGPGSIPKLGGLEPKALGPVPLELARKIF